MYGNATQHIADIHLTLSCTQVDPKWTPSGPQTHPDQQKEGPKERGTGVLGKGRTFDFALCCPPHTSMIVKGGERGREGEGYGVAGGGEGEVWDMGAATILYLSNVMQAGGVGIMAEDKQTARHQQH